MVRKEKRSSLTISTKIIDKNGKTNTLMLVEN